VARFCNLYWTLGVGSSGAKLTKRPPEKAAKAKRFESAEPEPMGDATEQTQWEKDWETID
jgi:hypothetical protein